MPDIDGRPATSGAAPLPAGSASSAGAPAAASASAAPRPTPAPGEADGVAAPDTSANGEVAGSAEANGAVDTAPAPPGETDETDDTADAADTADGAEAADAVEAAEAGDAAEAAEAVDTAEAGDAAEGVDGEANDTTDGAGGVGAAGTGKGRGRPPSRLFDIRTELPGRYRWALGAVGLAAVLGLWLWAASRNTKGIVVPSPAETYTALREMHDEGVLWDALGASGYRILYGYAISMAIGIVVGLLMGAVQSVEAFVEAPIGFMRYVPAGALTPLMIGWLGIDETPKITLIVIGTVFFNILMVADVARAVPRELIEASYTLGARRSTVLYKVIFRHSLPGIIDVARINLAAGWLMLVVAELLAAEEGLAVLIMKVQRARAYDTMFAALFVFGVVGVLSDLLLRWLRNRSSPWARP